MINTLKDLKNINEEELDWDYISDYRELSENFIRKYDDYVNWFRISMCQRLSEDFIREYEEYVNWCNISKYQKLSENFIREYYYKVNWVRISIYQKLSENFIREFEDRVDWDAISIHQKLSEKFIMDFEHEVDWRVIPVCQNLSRKLAKEHNLTERLEIINLHKTLTPERRKQRALEFAIKHELPIDSEYLYAYKSLNNDYTPHGGYELNTYYRNWRCDPRPNPGRSYGFDIWAREEYGDCLVRVKLEDFVVGVWPYDKARVWGFEIIEEY